MTEDHDRKLADLIARSEALQKRQERLEVAIVAAIWFCLACLVVQVIVVITRAAA